MAFVAVALAACGGSSSPPRQTQAPAPLTPASAPSTRSYPSLPSVPFEPARPPEIVQAVFHFAADHPEVLGQMPCFCGCQNRGHKNNDDCFVTARDERGRVTAWEPHGIG